MRPSHLFALLTLTGFTHAQSDTCANAPSITGAGSWFFDFSHGSSFTDTDSPTCSQPYAVADAWYAWTTTAHTDWSLVNPSIGSFSGITLYDACGGNELGCATGWFAPGIAILDLVGLAPNTTYWIMFESDCPALLDISELFLAPNDECVNAEPIAGIGQFPVSNVGSTDSGVMPACETPGSIISDTWYRWTSGLATDYHVTVPEAGPYNASVVSIAVFDSCGGNELACDAGYPSFTLSGVTPNTPYYIRVNGPSGLEFPATLSIEPTGPLPPVGTTYCTSLPNSSGNAAALEAFGYPALSYASLDLHATSLPPSVNGLFFYGLAPTNQLFGDGVRCVAGAVQRLPFQTSSATGVMIQEDVFSQSMSNFPLDVGTFYFQAIYRDTAAMLSGLNTSAAVLILFGP